jgi:hypothetical protein
LAVVGVVGGCESTIAKAIDWAAIAELFGDPVTRITLQPRVWVAIDSVPNLEQHSERASQNDAGPDAGDLSAEETAAVRGVHRWWFSEFAGRPAPPLPERVGYFIFAIGGEAQLG